VRSRYSNAGRSLNQDLARSGQVPHAGRRRRPDADRLMTARAGSDAQPRSHLLFRPHCQGLVSREPALPVQSPRANRPRGASCADLGASQQACPGWGRISPLSGYPHQRHLVRQPGGTRGEGHPSVHGAPHDPVAGQESAPRGMGAGRKRAKAPWIREMGACVGNGMAPGAYGVVVSRLPAARIGNSGAA
jgi:hypothetical protein